MKIAIIGAGISGLVAAYLLHEDHEIMLYEANDYAGGHTHTVDAAIDGVHCAVDTGFIVFNETTYPNFCTILRRLGVESQPSSMTFSVRCEKTGLEYSPHSLNTFFAQRRNLFDPSFYRMIANIARFRREIERLVAGGGEGQELGPYLLSRGYSKRFLDHFLIPLGSSLWSADPTQVRGFPLEMLARFFKNHGFLEIHHPLKWLVVKGGSREYVRRITAFFPDRIRLSTPVHGVRRFPERVEVELAGGRIESFDHVVLAVHSDQALALLKDPGDAEREILAAMPYQANLAVLHTDTSILPRRRALWSSWNYLIPSREIGRTALTYDMNILQTITSPVEFCVTLNRSDAVSSASVIGEYTYHHPQYTTHATASQKRHAEISGVNRTHYCGAYWGYGFHEDGVNGALAACRFFGKGL